MKKPSEFFLLLFSSPYYSVIVNFLGCIENINNCDQLIIMGPIIPVNLRAKAKIKSEFNQNCNTFKQI